MDSEQKFSKASTNYLSNPLVLTQMLVGAPHCLSVLLRVVKSVLFSISTISIHKGSSKITKNFSGHSLSFGWWQIFDSLLNLVCFGPKRQPRESQEPSFSGFLNFFIFYKISVEKNTSRPSVMSLLSVIGSDNGKGCLTNDLLARKLSRMPVGQKFL